MTNRVLYLFPDTNLFIQCRPLEEIDWSDCGDFEEIHLIVCRPVQREIDNQKSRGNDRVGRRARKANSIFQSIVSSNEGYHLVRESAPHVRLYIDPTNLPSQDLKDRLDYSKLDDEIAGCCYRYREEQESSSVQLLTHDTGLMMTAKSISLSFTPVKDEWLLPPESTTKEREVARLQNELERLKKADPLFQIRCIDEQGKEIESIEVECGVYSPLTDDEVRELLRKLRDGFPPIDEVDAAKLHVKHNNQPPWRKEERVPPSRGDIDEYNRHLVDWRRDCQAKLSGLHLALQQSSRPFLRFAIANEGTRPGSGTLVDISGKGGFRVYPQSEDDQEGNLLLPRPPLRPRGRQKSSLIGFNEGISRSPILTPRSADIVPPTTHRRDPNGFYYKPTRPTGPVESYSLECEQWRHGTGDHFFDVEICVDGRGDEVSGAIACVVHAENLTTPCKKLVQVNIKVKRENSKDYASALVLNLLQPQASAGR